MNIIDAQADHRRGYMSGAAGILASSIAWFVAAYVAWQISAEQAVWALFIGGMLIYPVGVVISKVLGASGTASKGNPLGGLAIASTFWLIFSLPLAYVVSLQQLEWFFPAMLLVIGGRYLTFATLFGMRLYWVLGLALAGAGFALGYGMEAPALTAVVGASIELVFAIAAFVMHARWSRA